MSEYCIISDGSCDLPTDLAAKENITVVPFYVSFDEKNYMKEGVDIGVRVELPAVVFAHLTDELYESKIVYRTE